MASDATPGVKKEVVLNEWMRDTHNKLEMLEKV